MAGYSILLEKKTDSTRSIFLPINHSRKFHLRKCPVKIIKYKQLVKMNSFQTNERKRFKKMLLELVAENQPIPSSPIGSKKFTIDHSQTWPRSELSKNIELNNSKKSLDNNDMIHLDKNKFNNETKLTKSIQVLQWKLPVITNDYKISMKNLLQSDIKRFNLTDQDKQHYSNIENQLSEKLQISSMLKKSREEFSRFKSFFMPIPKLLNRFLKTYIPFRQHDHEISTDVQLPDICTDIDNEVDKIIHSENRLIVAEYSINIYTKDLLTLCGSTWLNDAVIEFYLNLIVNRATERNDLPSVFSFNTYFFPRLSNDQPVGRWAKKLDFFSYDLLLVPIHHSNHWRLVVVDNKNKTVIYYDSLGFKFPECLDLIVKFLENESLTKKQLTLNMDDWSVYSEEDIPLQSNHYDCGVFTCKYAEFVCRRAPLTFNQFDIPKFRREMIYEIAHQKLLT